MINYIEIISKHYPTIGCNIVGDPNIYENINWDNVNDIISKEELDALFLPTIKHTIWQDIKAYREYKKFNGVYVSGKWFHNDNESRVQWLGLKDKARDLLANGGDENTQIPIRYPDEEESEDIIWITMDNTGIPVTAGLSFDVVNAVGYNDVLCHKIALIHKYNMYNSETPESYDYKTGWPTVFGE